MIVDESQNLLKKDIVLAIELQERSIVLVFHVFANLVKLLVAQLSFWLGQVAKFSGQVWQLFYANCCLFGFFYRLFLVL